MISDHIPYNFTLGEGDSASVFQLRNNRKRLYYAYKNVWVAVGEELPCQSVRTNSEDPFAVAVTAGELIKSFHSRSMFLQQFELLDPRLDDNALGFLNSSSA